MRESDNVVCVQSYAANVSFEPNEIQYLGGGSLGRARATSNPPFPVRSSSVAAENGIFPKWFALSDAHRPSPQVQLKKSNNMISHGGGRSTTDAEARLGIGLHCGEDLLTK